MRIPELDGLRGLAILLVVFYHYVFCGFRTEDGSLLARFIHAVFPLSWSGVDLFFVLSGFLIGGILMDCRNAENYFRTFYIRRICRTFPLYFLWLGLFFVMAWLLSSFAGRNWHEIVFQREIPKFPQWGYALFLQNFYIAKTEAFGPSWLAATWSLVVEEQFYLLLPLVIWFVPPRKFLGVLISLILFVSAFRIFLFLYHPKVFMYVLLPCRADALLLGVLCAYLVRQNTPLSWLKKNRGWLYLILGVLVTGAGCLTVFANGKDAFELFNSFEMVSFGYSWIAMLYACLLLILATAQTDWIADVMRFPFLRFLGIVAYGIFLMHMAVGDLAYGLIVGKEFAIKNLLDAAVIFAAFLITLFFATLSWRFLEKPIIRWGHSFSYNGSRREGSI